MMRIFCLALFLLLLSTNALAQNGVEKQYMTGNVTTVVGTDLATLPYVWDVMRRIPNLTVEEDGVNVVGRGSAQIYIGNRKVTDITELLQLAASKVASVEVVTMPGAQYDKLADAVIVITLLDAYKEGFSVNEMLRFDVTHKVAPNNELELGWKRKGLYLQGFFAYNEERKNFDKQQFKYHYDNGHLIDAEVPPLQHPDVYRQRLTGRLMGSYDFNANNSLMVKYSYSRLRHNRTFTPETPALEDNPAGRHEVNLEYNGKSGAWNWAVGNSTSSEEINELTEKPQAYEVYNRKELYVRTYANAQTKLLKGNLSFGVEYEYDRMNLEKYVADRPRPTFGNFLLRVHASHPDHTVAAYVSTTQRFGRWEVEGGVRYEHRYSAYKPYADDGLMMIVDRLRPILDPNFFHRNQILKMLITDGYLHSTGDVFFPSLKVSTFWGKSTFTLSHTQNSVRPYLGMTRYTLNEVNIMDQRTVLPERDVLTSLDWQYKWLGMTITHARYVDPICATMDGSVSYNAPDYDALNFNVTLSPRIGWWSPVLGFFVHKQWFNMPLANKKDKLYDVFLNASWTNTVTFPHNWLLHVDAQWHSRGADRNWYYYSNNVTLDASLQKTFTRPNLTVTLSATNLLNNSYNDVTKSTQAFYKISEGVKERIVRTVSLSVNYKF